MRNNPITTTTAPSYLADIFIAGSYDAAIEACRDFCMDGMCVNVSRCDYVFTGGMEAGVRVGLINYPRFRKSPDEIDAVAEKLARFLIDRLHQQSCSIVTTRETTWLSRRNWQ